MSADLISLRTISRPAADLRSTPKLFLLRLYDMKKPMPVPSRRRVLSPRGSGSILITSAPRSPRIRPALGPMIMCTNSTTRIPASGNAASSVDIPSPLAAEQVFQHRIIDPERLGAEARERHPLGQGIGLQVGDHCGNRNTC